MSKLMIGRRALLTLAVAAGSVLVLPTQAGATQAGLPAVISANAPQLHPEGVAWDPLRRSFLVSSLRHGTVSVVRPDGQVRTLAADPRMISTFGVHVDAARGRVLTAYGDFGLSPRSTPATVRKSAGLGVFDLRTGRLLHLVDLAIGAGEHAANDLAIDPAGNAYVTDPLSDAIHRVDVHGRASVLVRDPRLLTNGIGMNGIVWHPRGHLLAVNYATGVLWRIPLANPAALAQVTLPEPLVGGDGLDLRPDGSLTVVTNNLSAPGRVAIRVLRSTDGWRSAQVTRRAEPWTDTEPTTVTSTPHGSYVLDGRLATLLAGKPVDTFTLRRLA
ncbi:SMP-30/gluconolactonase/LRE family protein [Crossiella sp. CA198]|uniref:SMP-30/gluconolactonase/LRE family protein n=1 Tax=Crossiella sp. CA198 TaxID=3455607 RepID=UPI003F8D0308